MMLGAQALRTKQKAEKQEKEKRKQKKVAKAQLEKERENLQRAAKRFGEAATSALLEYSPSFSRRSLQRPNSARTHSIYDFALSGGRDKSPKLIKPRFSLNVGSLSARNPRPSPSFERIQALLLSPRSASGGSDQLSTNVRARAGSGQSTKSSICPSSPAAGGGHRSSFSSAGTRLLRWLGILPQSSADGDNRHNGAKNGRKKSSTTKRRMSAF